MGSEAVQQVEEIKTQVYHLRRGGLTISEIAQKLHLPHDTVNGYFRSVQRQAAAHYTPENRASLLMLEIDRLDALQAAIWDSAMCGDQKAVTTVLNIITSRAKLLGLDVAHANETNHTANVLVIGEATQDFIDALTHGRKKLTSATLDDGDETKEG